MKDKFHVSMYSSHYVTEKRTNPVFLKMQSIYQMNAFESLAKPFKIHISDRISDSEPL